MHESQHRNPDIPTRRLSKEVKATPHFTQFPAKKTDIFYHFDIRNNISQYHEVKEFHMMTDNIVLPSDVFIGICTMT